MNYSFKWFVNKHTRNGNGIFSLAALRALTLLTSRSLRGAFASHSSTLIVLRAGIIAGGRLDCNWREDAMLRQLLWETVTTLNPKVPARFIFVSSAPEPVYPSLNTADKK